MKSPKKSPTLAIMISFCIIALFASGVFYYSNGRVSDSESKTKPKAIFSTLVDNEREKETIMQELKDLKKTYDAIIIQNKTISLQLIQERDKVMVLMTDLEASKGLKISLDKYKGQLKSLQNKLQFISVENSKLKEQNVSIKKQNGLMKEERYMTEEILKESQKNSENLKKDLLTTVEKLSKVDVSGTTIIAYKLKSSGELIITDKAIKVDGINVSFVVGKNEVAKSGTKIYYIQVVDNENKVLGDSDGTHQYKSLTYSFTTNVNYDRKLIHVSENLLGKKFNKGTYYVNIYDKEELVDESSFILK